ncbi:MAG: hypothetical protein Q4615_14525 [Paracoccus aminovorans]|nr:hypothetical protein [Paracoccus aminovorans]
MEFEDLPEDDEIAFLILEKEFRSDFENETSQSSLTNAFFLNLCDLYRSRVAEAVESLSIDLEIPPISASNAWEDVRRIQNAISAFQVRVRIRRSRKQSELSVALDNDYRSTVSAYLDKVRAALLQADVPEEKKQQLLRLIEKLQTEINEPRTRIERVSATVGAVASIVSTLDDKIGIHIYKWVMLALGQIEEAKSAQKMIADARKKALPKPTDR